MITVHYIPGRVSGLAVRAWREASGVTNPERMPVWKSVDRIRIHWLTALVLADVFYGGVTMFGGRSESAAQVLLRNIVPIGLWGVTLCVAGLMIWFGWYVYGSVLGIIAWGLLAAASVSSVLTGTALSLSGPILLGWATGCHILIAYEVVAEIDADRERKQKRKD